MRETSARAARFSSQSPAHLNKNARAALRKKQGKEIHRARNNSRGFKYGPIIADPIDYEDLPLSDIDLYEMMDVYEMPEMTTCAEKFTQESVEERVRREMTESKQEWLGVDEHKEFSANEEIAPALASKYLELREENKEGVEFLRLRTVVQRVFGKTLSRMQLMDLGGKVATHMGRHSGTRKLRVHDYDQERGDVDGSYLVHHYTRQDLSKLLVALALTIP